jgi:hypothetical protein
MGNPWFSQMSNSRFYEQLNAALVELLPNAIPIMRDGYPGYKRIELIK